MRVTIHTQHFTLTPALKRYIDENLTQPLEAIWSKEGALLEVYLRDLRGGDKAGVDQECRCTLTLPAGPKLVITEVTPEMRTSIHQSRRRLLRRVRSHVGQRQGAGRRPRKYFFARMENEDQPRRPRHAPLPRHAEGG
jgi:ribosome-associated translation inhibitor RaiA